MRNDIEKLGDLNLEDTKETLVPAPAKVKPLLLALLIIALILGGGLYYFYGNTKPQPQTATASSPPQPVATPHPLPTPRPEADPLANPPEPVVTEKPLPHLDTSDEPVLTELKESPQLSQLAALLTPEDVLRKSVRAAYNLSKGAVVPQYRPLKGPDSAFRAQAIGRMAKVPAPTTKEGYVQTAVFKNPPQNQQRYDLYAQIATSLDTETLVSLYQLYYPLLQQAYDELGEGPDSFHSVVLTAVESFLATPATDSEPELILTSVQYQFLDPALESLPNTQKLLLRMGNENKRSIMEKLTELESALVRLDL
ncbi:DUF3014 domain-containing protein [Teredinibacter haidensis]|uniref:DUF3014 domain-containing protein n=1 Tax=Teredinibacter haidensis TaxID=2731755 RepID=UPI000948F97C|nr:DUF3014 domain-containing protein [Teredinibacter haidensis]